MLIKPYIELQQLMERKGYNQKELAAASPAQRLPAV